MASPATIARPEPLKIERHVWVISGVVIVGMVMSILDTTIVNVALDTLGRDLHSPISQVQWVVTGYLLAQTVVTPVYVFAPKRLTTALPPVNVMKPEVVVAMLIAPLNQAVALSARFHAA